MDDLQTIDTFSSARHLTRFETLEAELTELKL